MKMPKSLARSEVRISVAAGLVVALLVVIAGAALAMTEERKYTAESVLVMLPSSDLDTSDSAAYYETLSRGQIIATFAEVADNLRFEQQAEQTLQLTEAQRATVTTAVTVVPDTSVILVRATADSAAVAEEVADGTTTLASSYLAGIAKPYRTEVVHNAQGSAYSSGTSPTLLFSLAILVALIAGLAIQQAVYHLMMTVGRSNRRDVNPNLNGDAKRGAHSRATVGRG
jgi:capsular polysaccharide biosynthesis protein